MLKKYVIFQPYGGSNSYIENMKRCWGKLYQVIPFSSAEGNISILYSTKAIILNWYETGLDCKKKRNLIFYKILGVKIIWVFHNHIPHNVIDNIDGAVEAKSNMKFLARLSDAVVIHSKHSQAFLKEYIHKTNKIFYVPHVNYMRQYRWAADDNEQETSSDFIFVFQGVIAPYKNIELLIRVFKELHLPNSQLHIAGRPCDAEYAHKIEELCEGTAIKIRLEYLSDHDVGMVIRQGDIMVLPYDLRSSMNSGAMLTAFTNKRTVIISANAMAQDYKEKDFLYVYDYMNENEHYQNLKSTMQQAYLNGKNKNRAMGYKACEYTEKYNSDTVVIQSLQELLHDI